MTDDRTTAALNQIAHALDVSVSAFYSLDQSSSLTSSTPEIPEILELLEAFDRITDPKVRCHCVEFIRKAASSSQPRRNDQDGGDETAGYDVPHNRGPGRS